MPTTHARLCAVTGACLSVLLAAQTVCGAAPKTDPKATAKAKQDIQAVYDRQSKGLAAKDVNAFFAGDAPDAVAIDVDGKSSPESEGRQMMTSLMTMMKHADSVSTVQSVALAGDGATVMVKQHTHMILTPPKQAASTPQPASVDLVIDSVSRDQWTKTPGGWKLKLSKDLSEVVKQDGKVISKK